MSGGVVSTTVMVWLQKATLLHVSIAIHVRVVLKAFEHEGLGKTVIFETTVMFVITPSQASTAVGVVNTTGFPHSTIWSRPQLRFGGVVSMIVIVWLQNAVLLQASLAIHVLVVLEITGQRGLAGALVVLTMIMLVMVPLQRSTAVGGVKMTGLSQSMI